VAPSFDRRIVGSRELSIVQTCQQRIPSRLGGGAALAGAYLHHRLSHDADLFFGSRESLREMVALLPDVAAQTNTALTVVRDAGTYVRVAISPTEAGVEMDLVFDPTPAIEPSETRVEGVVVESLADLRANKLTCLLSRSEPRDLVDLLFLDRAGYPPERDLVLALRKDSGLDPSILAWLLGQFPVAPLPQMLLPLAPAELAAFRDDLRERFRQAAVPEGSQ
jgi:hypothetical protein